MPFRTELRKPSFENVIAYSPGARKGTSYRPEPFVVVDVTTPVWIFFILTLASGITAPEESVTIPLISPVFEFCAFTMDAKKNCWDKQKKCSQIRHWLPHMNGQRTEKSGLCARDEVGGAGSFPWRFS